MQSSRAYWQITGLWLAATLFQLSMLAGCVSASYSPGEVNNPLNQLRLGQSYSDMVRVLGIPDHSQSEDRRTEETIILFVPIWNLAEAVGNFNPSSTQTYTYNRFGTITIGDENKIIRIKAYPKNKTATQSDISHQ
jgi:hypothetical protein